MRRLRYWLIRKLAGNDVVVMNAVVQGPLYGKAGATLIHGNTFVSAHADAG